MAINNQYLVDGTLLRRSFFDEDDNELKRIDYQGEFLFVNGKLDKIFTEEGYYMPAAAMSQAKNSSPSGGAGGGNSRVKKSDFGTYFYTLKDHLGHTRVVIDEEENVIQETAYYPYGGIIADLSTKTNYNYLYTGKEFIDSLGVNWYDHHARYYDPEVGRWFAIDPALQAASPYMAMGNNPMMMVDEDGEWFFAALAVGALIGAGSYTASIAFSKGGFDNWNWGGFFQSAGMGAVSGVATAGIGNVFGGLGGSVVNGVSTNSLGTQILNETGRALAHGVAQGGLGAIQGDNFFNGFASGGISSIAGSGFQAVGGKFAESALGSGSFGALSGGIGAELSGGDFWRGAGQGATVALLNHYMHDGIERLQRKRSLSDAMPQTGDKFYDEKGNLLWDTKMEGKPNVVRVIDNDNIDEYYSQLESAKARNMPRRLLRWTRKHSTEMNFIIGKNTVFTYPQASWKDIAAGLSIMGEGFAAGRASGGAYVRYGQNGLRGLGTHYGSTVNYGVTNYWKNYYTAKIFTPWW